MREEIDAGGVSRAGLSSARYFRCEDTPALRREIRSEDAPALLAGGFSTNNPDFALVSNPEPAPVSNPEPLSGSNPQPLSEWLLIPFGDVEVERAAMGDSFTFTRSHAEAAKRWFDRIGRKLAIDYEHQSIDSLNTRADGLRPAAGWIGGLEVREDGLWATQVQWTQRAAGLLRSGEYRYFSPVIYWADADYSELVGLGPVALTNDPAMHGVAALAASRRNSEFRIKNSESGEINSHETENRMEPETELSVLRRELAAREAEIASRDARLAEREGQVAERDAALTERDARIAGHDATLTERDALIAARNAEIAERDGAIAARNAEIALRNAEIAERDTHIAGREADLFVERGMRLGKVLDSTSADWRDDYLRDSAAAEMRLSRSPVLLPPGRVVSVDARGVALDADSLAAAGTAHRAVAHGNGAGGDTHRAVAHGNGAGALGGRFEAGAHGARLPNTAARWAALREFNHNASVFREMGIEPQDLEAFEKARCEGRVRKVVVE